MNRVLVIPVKDGVSSYLIPSVKVAVDVLGLSESLIRNIIMTGKPVRTAKGCDVFLDYEIEDTLGDPEPEVIAKKRAKENTKLSDKAVEARRAYKRDYYNKHKEARRAYKRDYYNKHKEACKRYLNNYWEKKAREADLTNKEGGEK